MSTPLDLAPIKAREKAATNGPWVHDRRDGDDLGAIAHDAGPVCSFGTSQDVDGWGYPPSDEDGAFIAAARTDAPALVAEVERLRDQLDECRANARDRALERKD